MLIFKYAKTKHFVWAGINLALIAALVLLLPELSPSLHIVLSLAHIIFYGFVLLRIRAGTTELKKQLPILNNPGTKAFNDFFQHIVFPVFQISAFWVALYFLELDALKWLLVAIQSYAFLTLLENLEAYKANFHIIESNTHFIYDLLTVLTAFLVFYSLFGIKEYWALNPYPLGLLGFIFSLGLLKQDIDRYSYYNKKNLFRVMALISVFLIIGVILLQLGNTRIAFIMAVAQYLLLSYLNQKARARKISLGLILEYSILIGIMAVVLSQVNV